MVFDRDAGDYPTKSTNSKNTTIQQDWGTSIKHTVTSDSSVGSTLDFKNSSISVKADFVGVGDRVLLDTSVDEESGGYEEYAYSKGFLTVKIEGSFGSGAVSPELDLLNFLSIKTVS